MTKETWLPINGYEGLYEISDLGNVRSLDRQVWNGRGYYTKKRRILKKTKTSTGYWKVELVDSGGVRKSKRVHRLVASAFIPKESGKELINHKDGNPLNNKVDNLEWCTQSENVKHAYDIGLMDSMPESQKEEIARKYKEDSSMSIYKLADKNRCSAMTISRILRNKGVKIRGKKPTYQIDRNKMIAMFENGVPNVEIAKEFKTNRHLIGMYKYKYKKGELKI